MVDGHLRAVAVYGVDDAVRIFEVDAQRLLAEDALDARIRRVADGVGVQVIGYCDADDIQVFFFEHLFVVGVGVYRALWKLGSLPHLVDNLREQIANRY